MYSCNLIRQLGVSILLDGSLFYTSLVTFIRSHRQEASPPSWFIWDHLVYDFLRTVTHILDACCQSMCLWYPQRKRRCYEKYDGRDNGHNESSTRICARVYDMVRWVNHWVCASLTSVRFKELNTLTVL